MKKLVLVRHGESEWNKENHPFSGGAVAISAKSTIWPISEGLCSTPTSAIRKSKPRDGSYSCPRQEKVAAGYAQACLNYSAFTQSDGIVQ